jgi:glucose-1-phosphate cytidylyltransferase
MWEDSPLQDLAKAGELMTYKHTGFWKCMDHLRDKNLLNQMWNKNEAQWKLWK